MAKATAADFLLWEATPLPLKDILALPKEQIVIYGRRIRLLLHFAFNLFCSNEVLRHRGIHRVL